jgi:hypothetical protein
MTNEEMRDQIEKSAQFERDAGGTIEINDRMPYVAIQMSNGDEYFFQGQEADELLDEHNASADRFNTSVEDSILHSAQGW